MTRKSRLPERTVMYPETRFFSPRRKKKNSRGRPRLHVRHNASRIYKTRYGYLHKVPFLRRVSQITRERCSHNFGHFHSMTPTRRRAESLSTLTSAAAFERRSTLGATKHEFQLLISRDMIRHIRRTRRRSTRMRLDAHTCYRHVASAVAHN